jgi:hypothetical protein
MHTNEEETKPFKVFCDDMYHYQDEDERYLVGSYDTLEEAVEKCCAILIENLLHLYEPGMTAEQLGAQWWSFGEDPWVSTPESSTENIPFSAAKALPALVVQIVEEQNKLVDKKTDI